MKVRYRASIVRLKKLVQLPLVRSVTFGDGGPTEVGPAREAEIVTIERPLTEAPVRLGPPRQEAKPRAGWVGFVRRLLMFGPFLATLFYVFFIASQLYGTEVRFTIKNGEGGNPMSGVGGAAAMLAGGGASGALGGLGDGYLVRDFLMSRDAMNRLDERIGLFERLRQRRLDPIWNVPKTANESDYYDLYQSLVTVRYAVMEQIVVLNVLGFSPQESLDIANALVKLSEEFADRMNSRSRDDWLRLIQAEVDRAEERATKARNAMAEWRNKNANVDPTMDVKLYGDLIGQLETQLSTALSDLAFIKSSPNGARHPRLAATEQRVATLRQQISDMRQRLAGNSNSTTANQISTYETLFMEEDFANKALDAVRSTMEQARVNVLKQQKYVVVVANPVVDLNPDYPDKWVLLPVSAVAGLGLWFFGSIFIGLFRDSRM